MGASRCSLRSAAWLARGRVAFRGRSIRVGCALTRRSGRLLGHFRQRVNALARREHAQLVTLFLGSSSRVRGGGRCSPRATSRCEDPRRRSMPEGSNFMLTYLRNVRGERHPVLKTQADRNRKRVHDSRESRALLGDLDEHFTGSSVLVLAHRSRSLRSPPHERRRSSRRAEWKTLANRAHEHVRAFSLGELERRFELGDLGVQLGGDRIGGGHRRRGLLALLLRGRERLTDLAVVAVEWRRLTPRRHASM